MNKRRATKMKSVLRNRPKENPPGSPNPLIKNEKLTTPMMMTVLKKISNKSQNQTSAKL
jgi:hypothetical protein